MTQILNYYIPEKRYVVLEGDVIRASQTTLEDAQKYMQPGRRIVIRYIPQIDWNKFEDAYSAARY